MSEKLSERLKGNALAYELLGERDLPSLLREAAAIVRAVEDAPVAYLHGKTRISPHASAIGTDGRPTPGKRVKLVEVKR